MQEDAWTVSIVYACSRGGSTFSVEFQHPEFMPPVDTREYAVRKFAWGPGQPGFWANRRDDRYRYEFSVGSRTNAASGGIYQPETTDILPYAQSAESFRSAADEELDRLEQNVRAYFASNATGEAETHGGPTGADAPEQVSPEVIPQSVRAEALQDALRDIAQRKKLIADHCEEMFAALDAAFPQIAKIIAGASDENGR